MLKQENRFKGRAGLMRVFRKGTVFRGQNCSVRFLSAKSSYRVSVIVSKKVSKSAVIRNRIRRRIYTYMRQRQTELPFGDYIISVFDERFATMPQVELESLLKALLKKVERP